MSCTCGTPTVCSTLWTVGNSPLRCNKYIDVMLNCGLNCFVHSLKGGQRSLRDDSVDFLGFHGSVCIVHVLDHLPCVIGTVIKTILTHLCLIVRAKPLKIFTLASVAQFLLQVSCRQTREKRCVLNLITRHNHGEFVFLVADGSATVSGRDCEFQEPTLRREYTVRRENHGGESHGEREELRPEETKDDEGINKVFLGTRRRSDRISFILIILNQEVQLVCREKNHSKIYIIDRNSSREKYTIRGDWRKAKTSEAKQIRLYMNCRKDGILYSICEIHKPNYHNQSRQQQQPQHARNSWRYDSSPSCLGGSSHGWVPVKTHSTPVPTSVERLWVVHQLHNTQE